MGNSVKTVMDDSSIYTGGQYMHNALCMVEKLLSFEYQVSDRLMQRLDRIIRQSWCLRHRSRQNKSVRTKSNTSWVKINEPSAGTLH